MSNDKKDAMPAWPISAAFVCVGPRPCHECEAQYQRALAAAWEARCRKLAADMSRIRDDAGNNDGARFDAKLALAAIGPLPELPTREGA